MRIILLLISIMLVAGNLSAATARQRSKQVLNEVWNEVSRRHFNKNFKTKYQKLYKKFEPKILKSTNDLELSKEINKLLQALGQSHIVLSPPLGASLSKAMSTISKNIAPNKKAIKGKKPPPDLPADTGISLSQTDNRICVTRVRKKSSGARAGIKMGDVILAINRITLHPEVKFHYDWPLIARALLSGQPESEVTVKILNAKGETRTLSLKRQVNGEKWFKLGVLPRSYSDFYATVLPGRVGYVQFTAFTTPMLLHFRKAVITKLRNIKALIIDMRGNVGGLLMYPPWLAAWCCPEVVHFGKLVIKGTTLKPKSSPQKKCFKGPIAILIDNYSYSCAEIFAAGMQDAKQAKLFGTTSSGKCLPSMFFKLPCGFRLQTVTGDIRRMNGGKIEGVGVKPDEKVILSIKSLQNGKDNVIESARKYLLKQ